MKKALSILAAAFILSCGIAFASGHGGHWSYSGHNGPEHWGELDEAFIMCGIGKNQTPINLTGFVEADLKAIDFDYKAGATEILNNGHAVQVNYNGGSNVTIDGKTFELKQFHFHSPSENNIEGKSFDMEAHLVHADKDGNLAVVTVMLTEGKSNKLIETLWKNLPKEEGEKHAVAKGLNVTGIMPKSKDYYRFNGSLTTPPCSEGVLWVVFKDAVEVSKGQIKAFQHAMHDHPTNRPIQPTNARPLLK